MDRTAFVIQGHRGARAVRPENALPSFEAALDAGATSLETDVHLTADGVPVLVHDPQLSEAIFRTMRNTADVPPPSSRPWVHRLTFEQLRGYVADRNPDPARFPDQSPTPGTLTDRLVASSDGNAYGVPTLADLYLLVAAYAGAPGRRAGKTDAQRANAARVVIDVELKRVPFRAAELGQPPERMEGQV